MKNFYLIFLTTLCLFSLFYACKKNDSVTLKQPEASLQATQSFTTLASSISNDADSTEVPTILGRQLTNPYLIPNMQQLTLIWGSQT